MRKTKYRHITPNLARIGMAIKSLCLTASGAAWITDRPTVGLIVMMVGATIDEIIKYYYNEDL